MSTIAQNKLSVIGATFQLLLFMIGGAALGAVCLGVGVYLSSFADRIEAFYKGGAVAGAVTGAAFSAARQWSHSRQMAVRAFPIAAILGAIAVWIVTSRPNLDMPVGPKIITCILWLFATVALMAIPRLRG